MNIPWHTLTITFLIVIAALQSCAIWLLGRSVQKLAIVLRAISKVQLDMWRLRAWP